MNSPDAQDPLPVAPDAQLEGIAPVNDRFTTTLFLAALFHGIVILGVTFAVPFQEDKGTPTLEVLLLTGDDTRAADNPNAQYLAQRSQQGSGTTDERVRPANPASSALPAQQQGVPDGNSSTGIRLIVASAAPVSMLVEPGPTDAVQTQVWSRSFCRA